MAHLGNLLKQALRIVPPEKFQYRKVLSVETNDIGNTIPTFSEWSDTMGSVQPGLTFSFNARGISSMLELKMVFKIGISQAKDIITVFTKDLDLVNTHFQEQPDQIKYDGRIFNIISVSNWLPYDSWKSLVCVEDTRYWEVLSEINAEEQTQGTATIPMEGD